MTDKQIIIDGIDVSGCDRLNAFPMQYGEPHEICLTSLEQWGGQEKYCKDRPNCYYKQLKRKEQECEELKWQLETKGKILAHIYEAKIEYSNEYRKLSKTLAEIKELMEIEIECKTYEIENDCFNETRCKTLKEHIDFTNEILQKISEVIPDEKS